ncbi:CaiB/BaiF CoA transferase family protein [Azospirillum rugosum]|uniref:Crotonobetainyl-CoA:carnitine CoA-transferase CaiB-like acyl-CoA transferase n=1 Tax=Azospirillum rugosum TaxID=416170 RepID=A0ABS4SND0_9PROT|nr:CoA transferase [Azospirillum rugosum]MBP2294059.1 crotonobetainyl-CoA:carnitine CoA-transferase CaiB-like acyl-CoA transferase [Azospirillum rugosum]MDQ0527552.1 crotonobetainyl-CoA:carnitine CoA-transferase CaiB-like acyl-CoA transferase [Azospirillum rugosum]
MPLPFLSGLRVVDLGQYLPGPHAAQLLADLGAAVVKVEPPDGDPLRRLGPTDADGMTAAYKLLNAGKTVVRLDLKSADGRAAFETLVAKADALVESYRPGVLDKLGIGRDRLRALNPRLVHASLSGWGSTGPYALRAGHDLNYMAVGGGLDSSGLPDRPMISHPPVADFASAQQTALAVAAALLGRERTGQGCFLDLSIMETVLGWQGFQLTAAARGTMPERGESLLSGGAACYRIYRTADGRFATLSALEAKFWRGFCEAVGRPDWIARQSDPLPQTALTAELEALFASRDLAAWKALLDPVDCCFEALPTLIEVADHPHVAARGQVRRGTGPEPLVETLMGLRVDGGPPPARDPLRESGLDAVLAAWS